MKNKIEIHILPDINTDQELIKKEISCLDDCNNYLEKSLYEEVIKQKRIIAMGAYVGIPKEI